MLPYEAFNNANVYVLNSLTSTPDPNEPTSVGRR